MHDAPRDNGYRRKIFGTRIRRLSLSCMLRPFGSSLWGLGMQCFMVLCSQECFDDAGLRHARPGTCFALSFRPALYTTLCLGGAGRRQLRCTPAARPQFMVAFLPMDPFLRCFWCKISAMKSFPNRCAASERCAENSAPACRSEDQSRASARFRTPICPGDPALPAQHLHCPKFRLN